MKSVFRLFTNEINTESTVYPSIRLICCLDGIGERELLKTACMLSREFPSLQFTVFELIDRHEGQWVEFFSSPDTTLSESDRQKLLTLLAPKIKQAEQNKDVKFGTPEYDYSVESITINDCYFDIEY
jgi:hypothetical protein